MNGIYLNVINNDKIYELKEEWKSYKCSKKRNEREEVNSSILKLEY